MKTKEFMAKVEALGFRVHDGHNYLEVIDTETEEIVDVLKRKRWVYDCEHAAFESLHEIKQTELMEIVTEYVTTQVKDREEEKRYYLRLATKIDVYEDRRYLNMDIPNEKYTLSENKDDAYYKAIFTETEISQMDITGFEKVEVSND